eukprot:2786515-Ditylum_brightwellii.AAC.1
MVLKLINNDELKVWGDRILVWYNIFRTKPPAELCVNGRCLPFIVDEKDDVYSSNMFSIPSQP